MKRNPTNRFRLACPVLGAFAVLWVIGFGASAFAEDDLGPARAAYAAGDFVAAGDMARLGESVEAKVLAARAYLAETGYVRIGLDAEDVLEDSLEVTTEAVVLDPDYVEAIIYRVIAIGYLSRTKGNWSAYNEGLGSDAEALIKRAIELEPQNPWALMTFAGWHSEIVAAAGSFLGSMMYGASGQKAVQLCDDALAIEPSHIVFNVECARTLMRLSLRKYGQAAVAMLNAGLATEPADAFDAVVQDHGRQLLEAYETGDKKTFKAVFRQLDAFRQ